MTLNANTKINIPGFDFLSFVSKHPPISNFKIFCRKQKIEFPDGLSYHQIDHINTCQYCKYAWLICYCCNQVSDKPLDLHQLEEAWSKITEKNRILMWSVYESKEAKWFERLRRIRKLNGFVLFIKNPNNKIVFECISDRSAHASKVWNAFPESTKLEWTNKAKKIIQESNEFIQNLPFFLKIRYKQFKRNYKQKRRKKSLRVRNAFLIFVQDRLDDYKSNTTTTETHREFTTRTGREWHALSDLQKQVYKDKSIAEKEQKLKELNLKSFDSIENASNDINFQEYRDGSDCDSDSDE
jgi:hypothetical protein